MTGQEVGRTDFLIACIIHSVALPGDQNLPIGEFVTYRIDFMPLQHFGGVLTSVGH
jgi:hypothetical protein